jgi:hypothetical protein
MGELVSTLDMVEFLDKLLLLSFLDKVLPCPAAGKSLKSGVLPS